MQYDDIWKVNIKIVFLSNTKSRWFKYLVTFTSVIYVILNIIHICFDVICSENTGMNISWGRRVFCFCIVQFQDKIFHSCNFKWSYVAVRLFLYYRLSYVVANCIGLLPVGECFAMKNSRGNSIHNLLYWKTCGM